jgi:hypothetical protein
MPHEHPFTLRGSAGAVTASYGPNDDPERWGYGILELPWPTDLARGLPVLEAQVDVALDGYAAVLGWIQVVSIRVSEMSTPLVEGAESAPPGEHRWVDGPPQLRGLGVPFLSFGVRPTLFDAPASTESDVDFVAHSFLTASPDGLISTVSEPCLGLGWGYSTVRGQPPTLHPLTVLGEQEWTAARPLLTETFPEWTFGAGWAS